MPMLLPKSMAGGGPADINIFTQIGFVVLVGLASKNAILIVEFAKHQREEGAPRHEATLAACKLRLRPIVMTSAAFILGALPLLIAHGAGAEMRRTLGTAVFSGMLGVTLFGIFLTPVFFNVIDWLGNTPVFRSRGVRSGPHLHFHLAFGWLWMLIKLAVELVRSPGPPHMPMDPLDEAIGEREEEERFLKETRGGGDAETGRGRRRETRRRGDGSSGDAETRRHGDTETRRRGERGDAETR